MPQMRITVQVPEEVFDLGDGHGLVDALLDAGVMEAIRAGLQEHYDDEGGPDDPWADLSPATVAERQRMLERGMLGPGVGADHPILVRTGELRSEVLEENAPGHVEEVVVEGEALVFRMGASSEKAQEATAGGYRTWTTFDERSASGYVPPRPVARIEDQAVAQVRDAIAEGLNEYLLRKVLG